MTDVVDRSTRSRMMSSIGRADTAPELAVRRYLHAAGVRFRLHGDTLLSTVDEYTNQDSRIRYRCGLCGEDADQAALKVKRGQRHGCQRLSASQATRRSREFVRLVEVLKVLGIELLTTASTYAGNRQPVHYRRSGCQEVLSAAPYLLRIWAARARKQTA